MVYFSYLKGVLATQQQIRLLQACNLPNIKLMSGYICIARSDFMITRVLRASCAVVNRLGASQFVKLIDATGTTPNATDDASCDFYQLDASLLSSCSKSNGFVKLHQISENHTRCNLIFADLLKVVKITCIKLVDKKSRQSTC